MSSTTKPVAVGAYQSPDAQDAEPVIKDKRKPIASPAKSVVDGVKEDLKKDIAAKTAPAGKSRTYGEILADNDITRDDAHAIVDAMLVEGYYEETISITKRVTVRLRTRSHADYRRYLRALEYLNPKFVDEQQEIMQRYFLAASLVEFRGRVFDHPNSTQKETEEVEAAFDDRLDWISAQSENVVVLLIEKLRKFDHRVSVVMSEGVIENF